MTILTADAAGFGAAVAQAVADTSITGITTTGDFPSGLGFNGFNRAAGHELTLDCSASNISQGKVYNSSGLNIVGGKWGRGAQYLGIQANGNQRILFDEIDVAGYGSCGLSIFRCSDVTIQRSDFHDTAHDAIDLKSILRVQILHNRFTRLVYGPDHTDAAQLQIDLGAGAWVNQGLRIWDNVVTGPCQGFGGYSDNPHIGGVSVLRNTLAISLSAGITFALVENTADPGWPNEMDGNVCYTLTGMPAGWIPPTCKMLPARPGVAIRIGTNVNGPVSKG
jgi:hypothetical protein